MSWRGREAPGGFVVGAYEKLGEAGKKYRRTPLMVMAMSCTPARDSAGSRTCNAMI